MFFDKIGWHPSIGDPTIYGWMIVAMYFMTAMLSGFVFGLGTQVFSAPVARQQKLWLVICLLMLLLGINKQLDLQSFFTASLKYISIKNDWYDQRHQYQVAFIYTIGFMSMMILAFLAVWYRRVIRQHWLAVCGLCFIVAFVVIRASSFHHVDFILGSELVGVPINRLLEFSGICLIMLNAIFLVRRAKSIRGRSQSHRPDH